MVTLWFMVGAFGHVASTQSVERLEIKVSRAGGHVCQCHQAPVKTLNAKVQVSLPSWQYPMHIVTHQCQGSNTAHDFAEAQHLVFFLDSIPVQSLV